jgi:heme exporter protein C
MNAFRFAAPQTFYPLAGAMVPWFAAAAIALAAAGLWVGFGIAPADFQQGEVYRIIFIHVPSAWMAMFVYVVMAGYAVLTLGFRTRLSAMMCRALAPTGALMAAISLWTGAIWGRPTWGTYWVWDARLTSTLILLFLYLGYMALIAAIEDEQRADRAGALLLLVGVHQGASVSLTAAPKMASTMLTGMLLMSLAAWMYTIAAALHRVRSIILERERHTRWVRQLAGGAAT